MTDNTQHDADVAAVVAVMDAAGALPFDQFHSMPALAAALNALYEQFEDRINEHDKDMRYAKLSATFGEDAARAEVYGDGNVGA